MGKQLVNPVSGEVRVTAVQVHLGPAEEPHRVGTHGAL
jgi:hypothetical protein